jgi:hypothetical protein
MKAKGTNSIESTSIWPSLTRYRPPRFTWGRCQRRNVTVMSPDKTEARSSRLKPRRQRTVARAVQDIGGLRSDCPASPSRAVLCHHRLAWMCIVKWDIRHILQEPRFREEQGGFTNLWLDHAYCSDAGLVIPGSPQRYAADFRLSVDGVHVKRVGIDVVLPWAQSGRSWHLGSYVRGSKTVTRAGLPSTPSGGMINAGLYARGEYADRMVPIFMSLRASRRRLPFTDPFKRGIEMSYVVPLYARRNATLLSRDAWSIWNLCLLLTQRPELQPRLGDPRRTENLLRDLRGHQLPVARGHLGVRTESIQIRTAMKGANLVHTLGGRPVPGDALVERNEALAKIVNRIVTSPYGKGAKVNQKHVEEILDAEYFNIEPWPFAALIEGPGHP